MDVEGVIIDHHQISYKSGYPEDYCIYLLKKGHTFPSIINLDSTTFPYFASYMTNVLMARCLKSNEVMTKITLRKAMGLGDKSTLPIQFNIVRVLDKDETKEMQKLTRSWQVFTRREKLSGGLKK